MHRSSLQTEVKDIRTRVHNQGQMKTIGIGKRSPFEKYPLEFGHGKVRGGE